MEKKIQKPSKLRILQSDYTTGLSLIVISLTWAAYLILSYYGKLPGTTLDASDAPFLLKTAICAIILFVPLIVWRINYYNSLFKNAEEIAGHITSIYFYRDRGKIIYEYIYKGEKYFAQNAIFKSENTRYYQKGDEIILLVDPKNPKKAIIRDIYI